MTRSELTRFRVKLINEYKVYSRTDFESEIIVSLLGLILNGVFNFSRNTIIASCRM